MGYVNNSPVKQIWLPLDYNFLNEHSDISFDAFSKFYKEKFGIDLHDVFTLEIFDGNEYTCGVKNDLTGVYVSGKYYGKCDIKWATPNAIERISTRIGQTESETSLLIHIGITDEYKSEGYGFAVMLPAKNVRVSSIDDLIVQLVEI